MSSTHRGPLVLLVTMALASLALAQDGKGRMTFDYPVSATGPAIAVDLHTSIEFVTRVRSVG